MIRTAFRKRDSSSHSWLPLNYERNWFVDQHDIKIAKNIGEYRLIDRVIVRKKNKIDLLLFKDHPDTISYARAIEERAISLASWAWHSWIRPALNLVRGFVRSPFLLLIPDPVEGPRPTVGRPRSTENHDNYYVRANCALPIVGRLDLTRSPRAIAIPRSL